MIETPADYRSFIFLVFK